MPKRSVIITAGFWAQLIYYNIRNKYDIIAVVDNDPMKQGKIFNSTQLIINKNSFLDTLGSDTTAIIFEGHYCRDEVVRTVLEHNKDIQIMYL